MSSITEAKEQVIVAKAKSNSKNIAALPTQPMRRDAAAEKLTELGYPTAKRTLDVLATRGGGPAYVYWGRIPLYSEESLLDWVRSRLSGPVHSTSDLG